MPMHVRSRTILVGIILIAALLRFGYLISIQSNPLPAYVANTGDDKISVIDLVNWRLDGEIVAGDEPDGMAWVSAQRTPSPQQ